MNIRQARLEDAPVLAQMRWDFRTEDSPADPASYAEFEAYFAQFMADALTNGRWAIWVIEQEGQILAHTYVQIIQKVPRPGHLDQCFGYITNVYARPEARNQGLGSQLMAHILDWAKAQPLEFVILWPSALSVPYYQRMGFDYPTDVLELYLDNE